MMFIFTCFRVVLCLKWLTRLILQHHVDTIPSRDTLVNSLVFNLGDVVQITAIGVDLDYANKGQCIVSNGGKQLMVVYLE